MSAYIYETHLHTKCASLCSPAEPEEYVHLYKEAGFQGFVVTEHFFNGNCGLQTGTWQYRVEQFQKGYERALLAAKGLDFDVFFGWESTYDGDDYLIYGLDGHWLLEHPEIVSASRREQYQMVHEAGGAVIQAHPFRQRDYIKTIHLSPNLVDGVEVANAQNDIEFDNRAYAYAKEHKLYMTAGSDIHRLTDVSPACYGVVSPVRWKSISDYVTLIKEKAAITLHCPSDCYLPAKSEPDLPVVVEN